MDPFVRMIYFAHEVAPSINNFVVVDIEKNPEIKERYDPKGKGKYFLIKKGHYSLINIEPEGSIQEVINQIEKEKIYENKNRICK